MTLEIQPLSLVLTGCWLLQSIRPFHTTHSIRIEFGSNPVTSRPHCTRANAHCVHTTTGFNAHRRSGSMNAHRMRIGVFTLRGTDPDSRMHNNSISREKHMIGTYTYVYTYAAERLCPTDFGHSPVPTRL